MSITLATAASCPERREGKHGDREVKAEHIVDRKRWRYWSAALAAGSVVLLGITGLPALPLGEPPTHLTRHLHRIVSVITG
jgi:hypothetical protein